MQISIIIATKNQVDVLLETLYKNTDAIKDYNDIELIVINDGEYFELPISLITKISLFKNPNTGVSSARNFGAKKATGTFLLFLDDDMWVSYEAILKIKEFIHTNDFLKSAYTINWTYPPYLIELYKKKKLGRYVLKHKHHTLEGRAQLTFSTADMLETHLIGSGSFLISKEVFLAVNGYDEAYAFQGEDIDLSKRLLNNGIQLFVTNHTKLEHNQIHRLNMINYLDRLYTGFKEQVKSSEIKDENINSFLIKKYKLFFYRICLPLEKVFLILFFMIPNTFLFDFISFKLINILSSIQLVKCLKNI